MAAEFDPGPYIQRIPATVGGASMKPQHVSHAGLDLYQCTDYSFCISPDEKQRQYIEVAILQELRRLIPPLGDAERSALRDSILTPNGINLRDALTIGFLESTGQYVFLDGHNRYSMLLKAWPGCAERAGVPVELVEGDDVPYRIVDLPDLAAAKLWILENQVSRRNLTDDQRAVIWNEIREARSNKLRAEQLAAAREGVSVNSSDTEKKDTRAAVAREANFPERKLRAAQEIKKADPELAAKVRAGDLTLKQAKRKAQAPVASKPSKELDVDGRYRKLYSAASSIYGKLPPEQRAAEIKSAVERLLRAFC